MVVDLILECYACCYGNDKACTQYRPRQVDAMNLKLESREINLQLDNEIVRYGVMFLK